MAIETHSLNPDSPEPLQDWWHYTISWDPRLPRELHCPCPTAACGMVEMGREVANCPHHGDFPRHNGLFQPKSGHPSRLCLRYIVPTTPRRREAATALGAQVHRLRFFGMLVPVYQQVEHPSYDKLSPEQG